MRRNKGCNGLTRPPPPEKDGAGAPLKLRYRTPSPLGAHVVAECGGSRGVGKTSGAHAPEYMPAVIYLTECRLPMIEQVGHPLLQPLPFDPGGGLG